MVHNKGIFLSTSRKNLLDTAFLQIQYVRVQLHKPISQKSLYSNVKHSVLKEENWRALFYEIDGSLRRGH